MNDLPPGAQRLILEGYLANRPHAYVRTAPDGSILETRGDLECFGLEDLHAGMPIQEHVFALQGMLPVRAPRPEVLPRIELVPGRSTDLHVGPDGDGVDFLFLDATLEAQRELHFQQRGNELGLMLRALGSAVFERREDGNFQLLSLAPTWLRALCGGAENLDLTERFPFIEGFLEDARGTWETGTPRVVASGMWVEEDAYGREWFLEAVATRLEDGRRLLILQTVSRRFEERQRILQRARSRNLDLDRMRREADQKEALLHCIVHDLRAPLSGMVGSMSLVKSRDLTPDRTRELLELGLEQARHQEAMIRGILDAFAAEIESLEHFESEAQLAPDLRAELEAAVTSYEPAFEQNGVALELELPSDLPEECKVVGEADRLERVVCNLLENALRHSPEKGVVRLRVEDRGDDYHVSVEDQGKGVPPEAESFIFMKFGRAGRGGAAGLGLYFCRSTVERWGGSIGYERIPDGGSRFWFQLPRAR